VALTAVFHPSNKRRGRGFKQEMVFRIPLLIAIAAVGRSYLRAQAPVTTGHYDNFRTGANTNETILNPSNVNPTQFGRLARLPVSGCVFAQPLYMPMVATPNNGPRNLVLIATTTNNVYAYDADNYSLQWNANFGVPFPSTIPWDGSYSDFFDCDLDPNWTQQGPVGIIGTPVIDVASQTMYFVANTMDGDPSAPLYHHFLHKLNLADGSDAIPPVEITGTYAGIPFQSRYQLQRPALLLDHDTVYIAFASHSDEGPYYGWMFSYGSDLTQKVAMNYAPVRGGAGIWQSGGGPASDGRYIYFSTGNNGVGYAQADDNSESIMQVDPVTLQVVGRTGFYPESDDWDWGIDIDLGSSRAIVMPGTNRVVSGSKLGDLFSVNQNGMMLEVRQQAAARHSVGEDWTGIYNGFAYWNGTIFVWPGGGGEVWPLLPPFPTDFLKAFALTPDFTAMNLLAQGQTDGTSVGYQGAAIVISANGADPTSGIVWASTPTENTPGPEPGFLHAYSASDFSNGIFHELWNNTQDAEDSGCAYAKFSQPLVANGKVFLPTFQGRVIVYGLLDAAAKSQAGTRRAARRDESSDPVFCSPLFPQP
jgi:hypothetical protein